jgi:hypothetical protein
MEKLIVHNRCGLGDHIICNGIVNHLSENNYVYLVCRAFTFETLRCLYKDNPNVELRTTRHLNLGVDHDRHVEQLAKELDARPFGIATHRVETARYQECMYEWSELPFEYRYSKFRLPTEIRGRQKLYERFRPKGKYALVHYEGGNGTNHIKWDRHISPDLEILEIRPKTSNLLDWIDLIIDAEEIHCIPSGPFHFVDSIWSQVKAKKVFHNSRFSSNFDPNNEYNDHCWDVVEYETKLWT